MEYIFINGKRYGFSKDFRDNEELREKYNELTEKTYKFNYKTWYQDGYWGESHIPYTLFDEESAAANVSVNKIKFSVLGEEKNYVQLGTVMTDEKYRHQGLSRYLMERVMKDMKSDCDLIFLLANKSVLDFYPKFGFRESKEYIYFKNTDYLKTNVHIKKLDMNDPENKKFLYKKVRDSIPLFKVSMLKNPELVMFYCTLFMKDFVYYIESLDTVVIAEYEGNILYLHDIFSDKKVMAGNIADIMSLPETEKVILGFAPEGEEFQTLLQTDRDNTLFVYSKDKIAFDDNELKFPELSHT